MRAIAFIIAVFALFYFVGCAPKYDWGALSKGVEKTRGR